MPTKNAIPAGEVNFCNREEERDQSKSRCDMSCVRCVGKCLKSIEHKQRRQKKIDKEPKTEQKEVLGFVVVRCVVVRRGNQF